jgi:hypothetical protein
MDPAPSLNYEEALSDPPRGATVMEWYEFLGVMILWDLARSVFTAWLTKSWIGKKAPIKRRKRKKRAK